MAISSTQQRRRHATHTPEHLSFADLLAEREALQAGGTPVVNVQVPQDGQEAFVVTSGSIGASVGLWRQLFAKELARA